MPFETAEASCRSVVVRTVSRCLDGVFGFAPRLERVFGVLRFELMIKRGLREQPQASGKEAQHEALCRPGRLRERDDRLHRG